jgi:hypothetical protein
MKANNVNGTSDNTCKCASWLDHWKKFGGGSTPTYCPVASCYKAPTLGAHVQKDSSTDRAWYIIPLCATHNAETGKSLEVGSITFVPANVSQTCGKK